MGHTLLSQKRGTGQRERRMLNGGTGQASAIEAACSLLGVERLICP